MVFVKFRAVVEGIYAMKEAKEQARLLWNTYPCGSSQMREGVTYGSREFFDDVSYRRYEVTDPWIKKIVNFNMAHGKKLLEIGYGIGTDLLMFCEGDAEVYGIDIAEEHFSLAQLNFATHQRQAVLKLCDGAEIDFPSNYFDYVYSLGVLHHTPDTARCISEAYRVLKKGGQLILGLYYTFSAYHLFYLLLYRGLFKGELKKLGYRGLLSTVEYGADGIHMRPLVKTFSKRQLRYLLSHFSSLDFKIAHFKRHHIPYGGRLIPSSLEKILDPVMGWYVIAFARK
jgi:ubiquinone/menaquinone biosynthesis C-methylase UbiE